MNKKISLLSAVALMSLTACGPRRTEDEASDPSSSMSLSEFSEVLKKYQGDNITYRSDVLFYYYPIDETYEQRIPLQQFDVTTKYTGVAYEFVSRFKGSDAVYSTFALSEGQNDAVTYSYIDLQGQVQSEVAKGDGETPLSWSKSVYRNKLSELSTDYLFEEEGKFQIETSIFGLISDIAVSASDTSTLPPEEIDSAYFTTDGTSLTLTIQEKESDQVYEGFWYGRTITTTFEGVGTTSFPGLQPLAEKPENAALKEALDALRAARNYTVSIDGYLDENPSVAIFRSQGLLTETDFYLTEAREVENAKRGYSGLHTHTDGKLYAFDSTDPNRLVGTTPQAGVTLDSIRPDLAFSHNFPSLAKTEPDGTQVYEMKGPEQVLDHVSFDQGLSQSYLAQSDKPIEFLVSADKKLSKITFPSMINSINESGVNVSKPGRWEVTYTSIGTTSTQDKFTGFTTDQETQAFTAWTDVALTLPEQGLENAGQVLDQELGAGLSKEIPFFLPKSIKSYADVSFEAGDGTQANPFVLYIYAPAESKATAEEFTSAQNVLQGAGFTPGADDYSKNIGGKLVSVVLLNDPEFTAEIYISPAA